MIRRMLAALLGYSRRRKETVEALARNREAGLWESIARGRPPGPAKDEALEKRDQREEQARRLAFIADQITVFRAGGDE